MYMTIKQPTTAEIESKTLNDLIRDEIRQALLQTRCTMPGKVVSFDGTRAKVQPLFKAVLKPNTDAISLPEIVDVPVCFPVSNGSSTYITLPIKEGDTGTLTFFDRDMAAWLYGDGKEVEPETLRIHDLTDATFTPDLTPFSKAIGADTDNLEVVNNSMSIVLHPNGKIEIKGTTAEMVAVLSSALGNISSFYTNLQSQVLIANGTCPSGGGALTGGTASFVAGAFTADKVALDADKTNLDTLKV